MMKKTIHVVRGLAGMALLIMPIILLTYTIAVRAAGKTPTVFGYSFSIVVTPSMEDVLPVGSVLLSREIQPDEELAVGDIITYHGTVGSYAGKRITHRVERVETDNAGEEVIITKGTNNLEEDPPIRREQVECVLVMSVLQLGWLYQLLSKPFGFAIVIVVPILAIIAMEGYSLIRLFRRDKGEDEWDGNEKEKPGKV